MYKYMCSIQRNSNDVDKRTKFICFFNGICRNIRMDTLAQILTYGNVHAFTNVAVVDTCSGLVVGAVLERLGGKEISYTCS